MHQKECEDLVASSDAIEAAIVLSDNGLPLVWHTRINAPIEEVASMSAGLIAAARELHLFDTETNASMLFETDFGALSIRTLPNATLLVLLLTKGYSFLSIDRTVRKCIDGAPIL